jgi:hypothetical protein
MCSIRGDFFIYKCTERVISANILHNYESFFAMLKFIWAARHVVIKDQYAISLKFSAA